LETSLSAKPGTRASVADQKSRSEFEKDVEPGAPSHGPAPGTIPLENSDLVPETRDDSPPASFDQSAESEFLAEARGRGEVVAARRVACADDETDPRNAPPLDELVKHIPHEIRETLDELFRVKFVRVQRVPPDALKK
jgi:hypothetical protein